MAVGLATGRREIVAAGAGAAIGVVLSLLLGPSAGIVAGGLLGPLVGMAMPDDGRQVAPDSDLTGLRVDLDEAMAEVDELPAEVDELPARDAP
jgi:hypothetical protein